MTNELVLGEFVKKENKLWPFSLLDTLFSFGPVCSGHDKNSPHMSVLQDLVDVFAFVQTASLPPFFARLQFLVRT